MNRLNTHVAYQRAAAQLTFKSPHSPDAKPLPEATMQAIVSHSVALAIHWFACLLFWRFNSFTLCLREELQAMEVSGQVILRVQTRVNQSMQGQYSQWLSTAYLLFYFGLLYSIAVTLLWWGRLS